MSLQKIHLAQDYIVEVINIKFKLSLKKKKFAFFYYHKKSVWEDLGTPELQGKVSTQFPLLLLNLLR